jgi:SAM-dependent methyltransferase
MFTAKNSDAHWEAYGKIDPYFGVLSDAKFHTSDLDSDRKGEFFETGQKHIDHVFEVIRTKLEPDFSPDSALDFGCGVGRLLVPLASHAEKVVGLDVSPSMIAEARTNLKERGISNVTCITEFTELDSAITFDFIHSVIVFQHIPVPKGERLFQTLVKRLSTGGVAAIHFTYYAKSHSRFVHWTLKNIPFAWNAYNVMLRRKPLYPIMQTNYYDLNRILSLLQVEKCSNVHIEFEQNKRNLGVVIYFQKHSAES